MKKVKKSLCIVFATALALSFMPAIALADEDEPALSNLPITGLPEVVSLSIYVLFSLGLFIMAGIIYMWLTSKN